LLFLGLWITIVWPCGIPIGGIPIPGALIALIALPIYGACGYEKEELLLRGYPVGTPRDDP